MTADRPEALFAGRHVLAELGGVDPALLDDPAFLEHALAGALTGAGATVCDIISHRFQPQGVTVLAMLAESHASVHSYPELGAAFVDVFTCGDAADPELAVTLLTEALGTESVRTDTVHRGMSRSGRSRCLDVHSG
ncbi:MAG: adenosylmethionine decarboxylase [Haloechinothrix sp.]